MKLKNNIQCVILFYIILNKKKKENGQYRKELKMLETHYQKVNLDASKVLYIMKTYIQQIQ